MFLYMGATSWLKEVDYMGIYLILYGLSLVLALGFFYMSKKDARFETFANFFVVLMLFFLAFALATKDPIEKLLTTIPAFWQFVLTALGGTFTIWQVYLNPLKIKVYSMDREIGEIKTSVTKVEKEVDMLVQNLIKDKKNK